MRPEGGARRQAASIVTTVTAVSALTPRMSRVRISGDGLRGLRATPGQTVKILVPDLGTGVPVGRDYTVRDHDPDAATMDIDFVLHGDGAAAVWAQRAEPGDTLEFVGPSGRHWPDPSADWMVFAGDETALPAIQAMVESLPASATVTLYLEVADADEEQPLRTAADVELHWLHRGAAEPGAPLEDALRVAPLPAGRGRIWVAGHTPTVRRVRTDLLARGGFDRRDLYIRGFWDRTGR